MDGTPLGIWLSGNTSPTASNIPKVLVSNDVFHAVQTMATTQQLALSSFMPSAASRTSRYLSSLTGNCARMATVSNFAPQLRSRQIPSTLLAEDGYANPRCGHTMPSMRAPSTLFSRRRYRSIIAVSKEIPVARIKIVQVKMREFPISNR